MRKKILTGKQKAAILMIALGPELSSDVFKNLREEEIETITLEIANIRKVEFQEKANILNEFHQMCVAQEYIAQGGINYAKEVLEKALGNEKALAIINRLTSHLQIRPFDLARKSDPNQILNFTQNEMPQTIALVLSYLDYEQAGSILSSLPQEKQAQVARKMALMDSTSPEIVQHVENILEGKLSTATSQDFTKTGGVEAVVKVLNKVDRTTERTILEELEKSDPELAEEIKKRMFVFEDIVILDKTAIQRIIREVEKEDLLLAIKGSNEQVKELLFNNMSKRMAETYKDEIEYMGPVRLRDVEEAQTRIVAKIRQLEEANEIHISRGGDEVVY